MDTLAQTCCASVGLASGKEDEFYMYAAPSSVVLDWLRVVWVELGCFFFFQFFRVFSVD